MSLFDLPNELLRFEIFTFLSIQDLCHIDMAVSNHLLRSLLFQIYPALRLKHSVGGVDSNELTWFFKRSISLKSIKISPKSSAAEITDIIQLLGQTEDVHMLDFTGCYHITDAAIIALSQNCSELTTVDLSECTQITDISIVALSQGCRTITTLVLRWCGRITDIVQPFSGFSALSTLS